MRPLWNGSGDYVSDAEDGLNNGDNFMAQNGSRLDLPKKYESPLWVLTFFSASKNIRFVCTSLFNYRSPDFPYLWGMLFFIYLNFSSRKQFGPSDENIDERRMIDKVLKKSHRFRILRSAGTILIREKLLDRLGVSLYDNFSRPYNWPKFSNRTDRITRIYFKNKTGVEYQFSRNSFEIYVREHDSNNNTYGDTKTRVPNMRDIQLLLTASNYFLLWYLTRLFRKDRKK